MNFYERLILRKMTSLAVATVAVSGAVYAYMTSDQFKEAADKAVNKAGELCKTVGKESIEIAKEFMNDLKKEEAPAEKVEGEPVEIEEESSGEKIDIQ